MPSARTTSEAENAMGKLVNLVDSPGLLEQTGGSRPIKEGLDYFTDEWRQKTGTDIAIAAIDPFVAKDRGATTLRENDNLALCAMNACERFSERQKQALLDCPKMNGFLSQCFAQNKPQSQVIHSTGSVFLVTASPFYESNQEKGKSPPVGVAAVATELSDQWVKNNDPDARSKVQEIVFAGDTISGQSLGDLEEARRLLDHFKNTQSDTFEFVRDEGSGPERYLARVGQFADATGDGAPQLISVKNLDEAVREPIARVRRKVLWGGIVLGALGAVLAYAIVYVVIRKISRLQGATQRVRGGDFETRVEIKGRDELASLGHAFNDMVTGLKALGIYTDPTLARGFVARNAEALAGKSVRVEGSIFFCDIRGFTSIAEELSAEALTEQLNEYFEAVALHVKQEGGYVDKFIGDSVMAFFGPPFTKGNDYASRACRAAFAAARAAAELRGRWASTGKPVFHQRIGIATGEIVLGNIGSSTKKNFTVIGDSVNVASRLEGVNKLYGTEILIDDRTLELAGSEVCTREIDEVSVRGKNKPLRIYELIGPLASATEVVRQRCGLYRTALACYRAGDILSALESLTQIEQLTPDDGPSQWLKERCRQSSPGLTST